MSVLFLDELDLSNALQEHGCAQPCRSVDGGPLRIGGTTYARGVGTHARSEIALDLAKGATRFDAVVGVDDEVEGKGSVVFEVWVDGRKAARTDILTGSETADISVDLTGANRLVLVVKDGGDGIGWDHADWADARLSLDPAATTSPRTVETSEWAYATLESPEPYLLIPKGVGAVVGGKFAFQVTATGSPPLRYGAHNLPEGLFIDSETGLISGTTPQAGEFEVEIEVSNALDSARRTMTISVLDLAYGKPLEPEIRGPRVVGTTPGRPFLFLIPAAGEPPLSHSARNLPEGLVLDEATGIISGSVMRPGEYTVELCVSNAHGTASRTLKIVAGEHKLAQTPPMGWNSWNAWGMSVSAEKVRAAADAMVESGLASVGFQYVNIDDGWPGARDDDGEIRANEKFGDMKALADYVHSKGLKIGIYSSPGPATCGGMEGSYQHEQQDALTWAKWGFDYVKYDWCSYQSIVTPTCRADHEKPYRIMRAALDKCDRDIVFSICWSEREVHIWGPAVGGNLWRTTGDIVDTWESVESIGFRHVGYHAYAGPGHWNDPDMLVVGKLGWGSNVHPSRLTAHEQVTHITLWSLLAAPLLIGCDMSQLDDFTLALLTNPEVIDVDQDPLGKAADRKSVDGETEVWARRLFDGAIAVGLFNRGEEEAEVTARWSELGLSGKCLVRDLWRRRDLGVFADSFTASVPKHGAMLLRIASAGD